MATIHWASGVGGDWGTAADWSGGKVPGAGDGVFIDPAGTYTVTIDSAEAAGSLTVNDAGATVADNNTLTIGTTLTVKAGTFELNSGGTIVGGTLSAIGAGVFAWDGGTLDGVKYEGVIDLSGNQPLVTLVGAVSMTGAGGTGLGVINDTGNLATLALAGGATINNATINLGNAGGNGAAIIDSDGSIVTLGAGTTINQTAANAGLGYSSFYGESSGTIVNDGTIVANFSGGQLDIAPTAFINTGSIAVSNGDTVNFQNTLTTAELGTVTTATGGVLNFAGTLNNTGAIFNAGVDAVLAGVIEGGAIEGVIDLSGNEPLLTLVGAVSMTGAGGTGLGVINDTGNLATLALAGGATINNATINLGNAGGNGAAIIDADGSVVTLGAGTTINQTAANAGLGYSSFYGDSSGTIVNDGTIVANFSGGQLDIAPAAFINSGSIAISNGDTMTTGPATFTNAVGGMISVAGTGTVATMGTNGGTWSNAGSITAGAGAALTIDPMAFTNAAGGSISVNGSGTVLDVTGAIFTNSGSIVVTGGATANLQPTTSFTNLTGTTLKGGNIEVDAGSTLNLNANTTIITDNATIILSGTGSVIQSLNTTTSKEVAIDSTLTTIGAAGTLELLANRNWTTTAAMSNAGTLKLGGATFTAASLTNTGTLSGYGAVDGPITDSGTISVQANKTLNLASATLSTLSGTTLTGGTYTVGTGGTLQLANNVSIVTLGATVALAGAGAVIQSLNTGTSSEVGLEATLTSIGTTGDLEALGARGYTTTNAIGNSGTIQIGGGTFASGAVTDAAGSTLSGFGTVTSVFSETGTVTSSGGALAFTGTGDMFSTALSGTGIDFAGGTDLLQSGSSLTSSAVGVSGGATVTFATSQSYAGALTQASGTALALGSNNLTLTGSGSSLSGSITSTGTLAIAGGTVAINTGASLSVSTLALTGGTTTLGESLTYAGAFNEGAGATLTLTTADKYTLSGATTLSGTVNGASTLKVSNATVNGLTIGGTAELDDTGSVIQTGAITVGDKTSSVATLTIAAGATYTIESGGVAIGKAKTSSIKNSGTLTYSGTGESVIAVKTDDTGSIIAASGVLDFAGALTGTGSMTVDSGATLEVDKPAASTLSMTFNGGGATLALKDVKKFAPTINGFAATDIIDILKKKATTATLGAGDTLVIKNGATAVATLQLTGTYTGDTFNVASDGNGGTNITVTTGGATSPPAALHPFIAAMASFGANPGSAAPNALSAYGGSHVPYLLTTPDLEFGSLRRMVNRTL